MNSGNKNSPKSKRASFQNRRNVHQLKTTQYDPTCTKRIPQSSDSPSSAASCVSIGSNRSKDILHDFNNDSTSFELQMLHGLQAEQKCQEKRQRILGEILQLHKSNRVHQTSQSPETENGPDPCMASFQNQPNTTQYASPCTR
ncbi:hypothetical protein AMECASPLE_024682, partial [Ameca splendens]